jgi:gamma-glutamyltranspeptidase
LPADVVLDLQGRGHVMQERGGISGDVQSIQIRDNGVLLGASDRRRGGLALGF